MPATTQKPKPKSTQTTRTTKRTPADVRLHHPLVIDMSSTSISNNADAVVPFLYGKIERLPVEMQEEVSLFTDFLLSKTSRAAKPKFGSLKGKIHLSADFDAPLPDFQEYMQ